MKDEGDSSTGIHPSADLFINLVYRGDGVLLITRDLCFAEGDKDVHKLAPSNATKSNVTKHEARAMLIFF